MEDKEATISNHHISLVIAAAGGSIVDVRISGIDVNPINFHFRQESGAQGLLQFRGHFLCLGRWGDPTADEISEGKKKHGDFASKTWSIEHTGLGCTMSASSSVEELRIERSVQLEHDRPVFRVSETVCTTTTDGKWYNMVQHPTLAAPFLYADVEVNCNATEGFDYAAPVYGQQTGRWPILRCADGKELNLETPGRAYNSVFPFIVDPEDETGWITAYSPNTQLLLGYCWNREFYPWINHWLHYEEGQCRFRGLEFGTTGAHMSIPEILDRGLNNMLGQPAICRIAPGESQCRQYTGFMISVPKDFRGVQGVEADEGEIRIIEKHSGSIIQI